MISINGQQFEDALSAYAILEKEKMNLGYVYQEKCMKADGNPAMIGLILEEKRNRAIELDSTLLELKKVLDKKRG